MEDSHALIRRASGKTHPCLVSKKALKSFHHICLDYVKEKNVSYLDQIILTDLLGGSDEVKPTEVADIMTQMVSKNMIQLLSDAEGKLMCKIIEENTLDLDSLTNDERLVYNRIQAAENNGIWSQSLAKSLNMGTMVLMRCCRSLENKRLIKKVKSVKGNWRIIYMLYDLEPSGELSGGPWYDDNKDLDVAFVNGLLEVIHRYIHKRSFPTSERVETSYGIKRVPRFYKPDYRGYPSAEQIYDWVIEAGILDDSVKESFGVSHVHKILEVLCYNNVIQKRRDGVTFRAILPDEELLDDDQDQYYDDELFDQEQADALFGHRGYTEAPCGRCPVFNICGNPGEEISAATCVYWNEWTSRVTPGELF